MEEEGEKSDIDIKGGVAVERYGRSDVAGEIFEEETKS